MEDAKNLWLIDIYYENFGRKNAFVELLFNGTRALFSFLYISRFWRKQVEESYAWVHSNFAEVFIKIDRRNYRGPYSIIRASNQNLSVKVKDFEEEASLAGNWRKTAGVHNRAPLIMDVDAFRRPLRGDNGNISTPKITDLRLSTAYLLLTSGTKLRPFRNNAAFNTSLPLPQK